MIILSPEKWETLRKHIWTLGVLILAAISMFGRSFLARSTMPAHLVIYSYSSQKEALERAIIPAFAQYWKAESGQSVIFECVFGPSGALAGRINLGAPADIAIFSNQQHAAWLKVGNQVNRDNQPITIGLTPMVIVLRPDLLQDIKDLADLAQEGLRLIHADPRSSGAGEWALLAEYGSAFLISGNEDKGYTQLDDIWQNVKFMAPSARVMMTLFEAGAGDALVTYEQEARLALDRGVTLDIVVPPRTIIAFPTTVLVDKNVTPDELSVALAFIQFLVSDDGQVLLNQYHLRTENMEHTSFAQVENPFTIDDLGGWTRAYELIDEYWHDEIEPRLDLETNNAQNDTGAN